LGRPCPWCCTGALARRRTICGAAISLGVNKVNVATDLVKPVRDTLLSRWQAGDNAWMPQSMAIAMQSVSEAVAKWNTPDGAEGRA